MTITEVAQILIFGIGPNIHNDIENAHFLQGQKIFVKWKQKMTF